MRPLAASILAWALCATGCFEDAPPVDDGETAPSTGAGCTAGTEGCACIDGACLAGLSCLSNVCVDPGGSGPTTTATSGPETTGVTSGPGMTSSMDSTVGPADTGPPPLTTDGGSIPPGGDCDPLFDLCEPGTACIGPSGDGIICLPPGTAGPGQPCEALDCGPGLYCAPSASFDLCSGNGCCTPFCDLFDPGTACPDSQVCDPLFPGAGPPPGYEHVGICVDNPSPA